jgi:hypothetical protein
MIDFPKVASRKELAGMLQCSVQTVIRMESTHGLKAARLPGSGQVRYNLDRARKILSLDTAPAPVKPRREFKQTFEPKPGRYTAPDEFK